MGVSTYNTKFSKIARYTPYLVSTEASRVQWLFNGLVAHLYNVVAPQMKVLIYYEAVGLIRKIKDKYSVERTTYDVHKKSN